MAIKVHKNVTVVVEMNGNDAAQLLFALYLMESIHTTDDTPGYGLTPEVAQTLRDTIKSLVSVIGAP